MENSLVRREPLTQQVYKVMKDSILTGKLKSGEKIVETKLAQLFRTSRSPVREAIRLLAAEKLLDMEDGLVRVFEPSLDDFVQIYELRTAIESMAAELAASRITNSDLKLLQDNLDATKVCVEEQRVHDLVELNAGFHNIILKSSQNNRFQFIMEEISVLVTYYWLRVLNINRQKTNILVEHTEIYQALLARDGSRARLAMARHIERDLEVVRAAYLNTSDKAINHLATFEA